MLAAVPPACQVYYLFSNNHINEIVSMRFDFDDDEVLVSWVWELHWSLVRRTSALQCGASTLHDRARPLTSHCGVTACRATTSTC